MVYGEGFESVNGLRSGWATATAGGATGSGALDPSQPFAAARRPSYKLSFASGTGTVRLTHRGMGNEGLVFQAGKPYEGYIFARAAAATTVTVALNDYTGGSTLATTTITVPAGGAWTQLNYTLTPSAGTTCVGITSDPAISCNNGQQPAFYDYMCVKCGGELSFGLSSPGTIWIGYARLEPGAWGRWAGLPIRIEAATNLQAMGITAMRYGGSVGSSVAWEVSSRGRRVVDAGDGSRVTTTASGLPPPCPPPRNPCPLLPPTQDFRGPVWNRTGLGRTWASADMCVVVGLETGGSGELRDGCGNGVQNAIASSPVTNAPPHTRPASIRPSASTFRSLPIPRCTTSNYRSRHATGRAGARSTPWTSPRR